MKALELHTREFYRPPADKLLAYAQQHGIDIHSSIGKTIKDAYEWLSPHIETDIFIRFLWRHLKTLPNFIHIRDELKAPAANSPTSSNWLKENYHALCKKYKADCIVNAAGLGANALVGDHRLYALRGGFYLGLQESLPSPQLESICIPITAEHVAENVDALSTEELQQRIHAQLPAEIAKLPRKDLIDYLKGLSVGSLPRMPLTHGSYDSEIVFIVPRGDKKLIIGGITQPLKDPKDWYPVTDPDFPPYVRMRARDFEFLPKIKDIKLDPEEAVRSGLRPFRPGDIRLEKEDPLPTDQKMLIIHSYGHGGAGWCLCWGCAKDVQALIHTHFKDNMTRSEQWVATWPDLRKSNL